MIFVDTNVLMYTVGSPHSLKDAAREFFEESSIHGVPLYTSAEVLQEILHAYLRVGRLSNFDAAISVIETSEIQVWSMESEDVFLARELSRRFPTLSSRYLCHLASCRRRGVREIKTYDAAFGAAAEAL